MKSRAAASLALGVLWLSTSVVWASQVRSVNLEEMTARAATIFSGRCIDVDTVSDPVLGRDVSVARFEVHRAIKGVTGSTVTVRMAADGDSTGNGADLPEFREGEEVVLFLYGESALRLRAPVGLGQGRFKVVTDKGGRPVALNALGNRNLRSNLSPQARGRLAAIADPGDGSEKLDPTILLDMAEALVEAAP